MTNFPGSYGENEKAVALTITATHCVLKTSHIVQITT